MDKKNYFRQLRQVFKNDPYQDRFLQELQDHAQDLESELPNSKKLTLSDMRDKFGEPKEVRKTFTQITRPWQKGLEIVEALGYGFLALFIIYLVPSFIGVSGEATLPGGDGLNVIFAPKIGVVLLQMVTIALPSYLFYRWAYFRLTCKIRLLNAWADFLLTILPSALVVLITFTFVISDPQIRAFALFVVHLSSVASALLAWWIPRKKAAKKKKKVERKFWATITSIFLFGYALTHTLIRLIDPSLSFLRSSDAIEIFFAPIVLPEMIFLTLFFNLTFWQPYVWVILFVIIGLFFAFFLAKKRFWLASAVLVYLVGVLFAPNYIPWKDNDFTVPAQELTGELEKKQFGPFYKIGRYLNEDNEPGFTYNAAFHSGSLVLEQKARHRSRTWDLPLNQPILEKSELIDSRTKVKAPDSSFYEHFQLTPNELECRSPKARDWVENPPPVVLSKLEPGMHCQEILWKGERIYWSQQGGFSVKYASISKDENWLILGSVQRIYLVDLRQINSIS